MPLREAKLETFDRFLRNVTERYAPDMIYVACNTLSVLLPDTPYFTEARIPVKGIVNTAVALLLEELDAQSVALIFGTQTTIDAAAYPRMLEARGIDPSRIVSQACPGLADTISEDREGSRARAEIERWVEIAMAKMPQRDARIVACLACTHYGYRKEFFAAALGEGATVINPNESAVGDIFDAGQTFLSVPAFNVGQTLLSVPAQTGVVLHEASVRFVTRYAIPPATVETLTWLLSGISPRTVAAMQHFEHVPELF
jgi:glutamate racemase